ncbi:MAG: AbrB family transcriptional regulator [Rhodovarius sp.]|nr:AbrB family transcriptional regulator [Rhodovarius sp.]
MHGLAIHLRTLTIATLGGALCHAAGIPLAWMIGAMTATAALAWFAPVAAHPWLRPAALMVLGFGFAQTFDAAVLAAVASTLPALVAGAFLSILAGIAALPVFTRLAGLDPRTGYFASIPGGVIVMVVLAQREGVAIAPVTLAQSVRVVLVVLTFPFAVAAFATPGAEAAYLATRPPVDPWGLALLLAAGAAVSLALHRTRLANPWLLGCFGLGLALMVAEAMPSGIPGWLLDAAQVGMGTTLGSRLTRDFLLRSRRLALAAVASALVLSLLCAALALALAWLSGLPVAAVLLGLAPGGMPEMGITAKTLGLAVPLVLGFHLTRTLACNLLVGPIYRAARRAGLLR